MERSWCNRITIPLWRRMRGGCNKEDDRQRRHPGNPVPVLPEGAGSYYCGQRPWGGRSAPWSVDGLSRLRRYPALHLWDDVAHGYAAGDERVGYAEAGCALQFP